MEKRRGGCHALGGRGGFLKEGVSHLEEAKESRPPSGSNKNKILKKKVFKPS
jgi:hypothetical protein